MAGTGALNLETVGRILSAICYTDTRVDCKQKESGSAHCDMSSRSATLLRDAGVINKVDEGLRIG